MRANGVQRHAIVVSGYIPPQSDEARAFTDAHQRIVAAVRKEMPLEGVDTLHTLLRTGINIGIYSAYSASTQSAPAHAQ